MNRGLVLLLLLLGLVNGALLTEIATYSRNTLEHHPDWVLGKSLLRHPPEPYGTKACAVTRELLAHNRLNLDAWRGFQEVLRRRPVEKLSRLRCRFRLADQAWLAVILHKQPATAQAVVLSRNAAFPSVVTNVDNDGMFLEPQRLEVKLDGGWHTFDADGAEVKIDGRSFPLPPGGPGLIGFRGSLARAEVDDVEVYDDGVRVLLESWRNDRNRGAVALHCFALVAMATSLLWLYHRHKSDKLLWLLLAHFTALIGLLMYLLVDYTAWSARYCENEPPEKLRLALAETLAGVDPVPPPTGEAAVRQWLSAERVEWPTNNIQVGERGIFDDAESIQAYRRAHPKPTRSILLLGASQLWGEGAARRDDTVSIKLAQRLEVEVVNAAQRGTWSGPLLKRYHDHLKLFEPDLVVLYLGSNDADPRGLEQRLEQVASEQPNLVLVLEANSWEKPPSEPPHIEQEHAAMREVAERHDLPCLDLNAYLREPEQITSGFLWWDIVHPTSHGHQLIAKFLAKNLP